MAEINKAGAPDKNTAGQLGDIWIDTVTGDRYKLAYISTTTTYDGVTKDYEWELVINEIPIDVATKEYVDEAILGAQLGGTGGSVDLSAYAKKTDIPTKTSSLINDSGFINEIPTEYAKKTDIPTKTSSLINDSGFINEIPNEYAKKTDIPTKTSSLINDSGFINEIPNEYVTEEELNKKGYLTSNTVLRIEVVSELPEVEEDGVLYIVK